MKIPESVRIGGVDYKIVIKENLHDGNNVAYGLINYDESIIYLNPREDHQAMCITLLHEIVHGIRRHACANFGGKEEKICDVISAGIYQVLQDNGNKFFDLCGSITADSAMCGNCPAINNKVEGDMK